MFRMSVIWKALVNKSNRCNISQCDYATIVVVFATITRGTIPAGYLKSLYKYTTSFGLSAHGPDKICSSKIWSTRSLVNDSACEARATPQFRNRKDSANDVFNRRLTLSRAEARRWIRIKSDGVKTLTEAIFYKHFYLRLSAYLYTEKRILLKYYLKI